MEENGRSGVGGALVGVTMAYHTESLIPTIQGTCGQSLKSIMGGDTMATGTGDDHETGESTPVRKRQWQHEHALTGNF
jgi:hypothetical protein